MAAVGAFLADGGFRNSDAKPFVLLSSRASQIWGDRAPRFLGLIGLMIVIVGIALHFFA